MMFRMAYRPWLMYLKYFVCTASIFHKATVESLLPQRVTENKSAPLLFLASVINRHSRHFFLLIQFYILFKIISSPELLGSQGELI